MIDAKQIVKIPLGNNTFKIELFSKILWDNNFRNYQAKAEGNVLSFLVRIKNDIELETLKGIAFAKFDVPYVLYQDSNGYVTKEINEAKEGL